MWNGSNSLRAPLVPEFPATLNDAQFSCEALKGAVGPTPPLMGLKAVPLPAGMAKQLAQLVQKLADVPKPRAADWAGAPVESVPGKDAPRGVLSSNPHGV